MMNYYTQQKGLNHVEISKYPLQIKSCFDFLKKIN